MTLQWLRLFGLVSLVAHHAALNLLERAIIEVLGVCAHCGRLKEHAGSS